MVYYSIEFDRDDELFATAGVSRRIKIFDFSTVSFYFSFYSIVINNNNNNKGWLIMV